MNDVTEKRNVSVDLWESGKLGREAAYAKRADEKEEAALDNALGLQMISIRLPRKLIDQLKLIASVNGVGYQPLIRDISRIRLHQSHRSSRGGFTNPAD